MSLFIENAFKVVVTSAAVWIGQLAGWLTVYTTWLGSLSPADQAYFNTQAQTHWVGIGVSFLTIVILPVARGISQKLNGGSTS